MQTAQGLAAVTAVVEEMRLLLHQNATSFAGQKANSEMIGERSGRHPHRGLFAEVCGNGLLELRHDAAD